MIELLVAATVTALLAGVLIAVTSGALNIWRRTQGGLAINAQARLVFDLLERDLGGAVYRERGEAMLAVDISNSPPDMAGRGWQTSSAMKPAGGESTRLLGDPDVAGSPRVTAARFGLSGVWLRLFTSNVATSGSLPVAVSYQIARRPISGGTSTSASIPVRYLLYRSFTTTDATYDHGYNVTDGNYMSALRAPSGAYAVCSNVVDFGVWLYQRKADGTLVRIFPGDGADFSHVAVGRRSADDADRFPAVADVMVRILTEDGAAQIENIEAGRLSRPGGFRTDAEWWWAVVEANSKVFGERIVIATQPP